MCGIFTTAGQIIPFYVDCVRLIFGAITVTVAFAWDDLEQLKCFI